MIRRIKQSITLLLLVGVLACGGSTLTKVINIFSSAGPLIASFQLDGGTAQTLTNDFADITQALKDVRDGKGTIGSVLSLLERLESRHISSQKAQARISAIIALSRTILAAFEPPQAAGPQKAGSANARAEANVDKEVEELRRLMKP